MFNIFLVHVCHNVLGKHFISFCLSLVLSSPVSNVIEFPHKWKKLVWPEAYVVVAQKNRFEEQSKKQNYISQRINIHLVLYDIFALKCLQWLASLNILVYRSQNASHFASRNAKHNWFILTKYSLLIIRKYIPFTRVLKYYFGYRECKAKFLRVKSTLSIAAVSYGSYV